MNATEPMELIATAAFGIEATVKWELGRLGYQAKAESPGRLVFQGDAAAIVRANLWLRAADRVLMVVGRFEAVDFDQLYSGLHSIPWKEYLPERAAIIVRVGVVRSPISSARSAQSIAKRAIVDALVGRGGTMDESGESVVVDVHILGNQVTVSLDTSGEGLHKRGYRPRAQAGQMKETLAAALVMICRWRREEPLLDPFCGSGTIAIEAAMLASNRAPGLNRTFASECWPTIGSELWASEREQAEAKIDAEGIAPIVGCDINPQAVGLARLGAHNAGVEDITEFQLRDYRQTQSEHAQGWVITNPPYGIRVGDEDEARQIHRDLPVILSRLPGWSHGIFLGVDDFEQLIGRRADRRRKLYNARIRCTLYQFYPGGDAKDQARPAFSVSINESLADTFRATLAKRVRHLRKWPDRRGIVAYRVYDRNTPGAELTIDRYGDHLRLVDHTGGERAGEAHRAIWTDHLKSIACEVTKTEPDRAHMVRPGEAARVQEKVLIDEAGLRFEVRPGDPEGAGLDLELRDARRWVQEHARGKRVLDWNARAGALVESATSAARLIALTDSDLQMSRIRRNLALNRIDEDRCEVIRADAFHGDGSSDGLFDLVLCSPCGSDRLVDVVRSGVRMLGPGGVMLVCLPGDGSDLTEAEVPGFGVREMTARLSPEDFDRRGAYQSWQVVRRSDSS